jgi:hypothetical protein
MAKLADLPDELLLRILEELDGDGYHSLALTSKQFHGLCIPLLYHSITINNFRQLEALVNRSTSGAWKLPPGAGIRHLRINASYINDFNIFMTFAQLQGMFFVASALAELVMNSPAGCLDSLTMRVGPLRSFVTAQTDPPHRFFRHFLYIRAKRIECTTTNALPNYLDLGRELWLDADDLAGQIRRNPFLEYLRIPFLHLDPESQHLGPVLQKKEQKQTLHLDWPFCPDGDILAEILWELKDTLADNGLIIAAPASDIERPELPQFLYRHFLYTNSGLNLESIQADLTAAGLDPEKCMGKLDWRIQEYDLLGAPLGQAAGQQQIQPAMIASDGMWMDLSEDGEQEEVAPGSAGGTGGWIRSLAGFVSRLW